MKKIWWIIIIAITLCIINFFVAPESLGQVSSPAYFKLNQTKIQPIVQTWGLDFTSSTVTSTIFCLTGDSCITTWPTGGSGSGLTSSTPWTTGGLALVNSPSSLTTFAGLTFTTSTGVLSVPSTVSTTNITATNVTSTNGTFTFLHALTSGGLDIVSNNGTNIALLGAGGGSNVTFYGGVNIDGTTRLNTSLTGLAYLTSGTVSATSSINALTITNVTTTNLTLSGFTNGSVLFATSSGRVTEDNSNLFWDDVNNRLGIGTTTPVRTLQVNGEVNSISNVTRRTSVGFSGLDSANNAAFPRAFFYGYSGSAISNFGLYAASGNATGTTQTASFIGMSTNADPKQASSIQALNYIDTTKYVIYTTQAENAQRAVPIYIGHFSQPDITIATTGRVGFGNVTAPSARLSLAADTTATGGLAFGTDTNLYRSAADTLTTDDALTVSGILTFTTSTGVALNASSIVSTTALTFTTGTGITLNLSNLLSSPTVSTTELTWDGTPNTDHSAVGNVTQTFNAGETITVMDMVFLSSAGTWRLSNASTSTSSTGMLAISLANGTAGNPMKVALPNSFVRDDTWNWTPGATLYVSTVNGAVTSTPPSATDQVLRIVGYAVTADVLYLNPSNDYLTLN